MTTDSFIATRAVAELVESYIRRELRDAGQNENRTPLDECGIYSLHMLAANIYAAGWRDGETVTMLRYEGQIRRQLSP